MALSVVRKNGVYVLIREAKEGSEELDGRNLLLCMHFASELSPFFSLEETIVPSDTPERRRSDQTTFKPFLSSLFLSFSDSLFILLSTRILFDSLKFSGCPGRRVKEEMALNKKEKR